MVELKIVYSCDAYENILSTWFATLFLSENMVAKQYATLFLFENMIAKKVATPFLLENMVATQVETLSLIFDKIQLRNMFYITQKYI
jgi:hypothetical protein